MLLIFNQPDQLSCVGQAAYYRAMENLTHSLTGLAVGELLDRCLPPETDPVLARQRHRLLLVSGWAASNFPDLDLFLARLLPAPLGYLLHHRGHTHTLLLLLPQLALLAACLYLLWPAARRVLHASAHARRGLAIAAGAGLLLHVAMDYMNSYGVHPFWPFDPRWYYGDMVMVVEPFFWLALGAPLAMTVPRPGWRAACLLLLASAPPLLAFGRFLLPAAAAALLAAGACTALAQWRFPRRGMLAALALCGAFVAMQALVARHARGIVEASLHARDPGSRVLDVALTAFPSDPLCWNFASVERDDDAGSYRLRRGVLRLEPARSCPARMVVPDVDIGVAPVTYTWESHGALAAMRELAASNCHFAAWLRYARVPEVNGVASDMRFSQDGQPNFTTIDYAALSGAPCPAGVPGWTPPREDLLH
jgi:inner membrane protein